MSRKGRYLQVQARASKIVLLTGGGGFVGKHLLDRLVRQSTPVTKLFAWSHHDDTIDKDDSAITWDAVDITDQQAVCTSIKAIQPSHVVHLAAISHLPTAARDPHRTWAVNVLGTLSLFEALQDYAPGAFVIMVSSSEVYGRAFLQYPKVDEMQLLQPMNSYAASKAAADIMAGQYAENGKLHICRVRPFNHVGPGQSEAFSVAGFAAQVARIEAGLQEPALKVGNLEAQRDFLDVRDVVDVYSRLLDGCGNLPNGVVLNVCSGVPRRMRDILGSLLRMSDTKIIVKREESRYRTSEIPTATGLPQKVVEMLGWKPKIPWDQTLYDVLAYWRRHYSERM